MIVKSTICPDVSCIGPDFTGAASPSPETANSTTPLATNALGTVKSRTASGITLPTFQVVPDPESLTAGKRALAEKRTTLLRFLLAATLAIVSVKVFPSVRVLGLLGLQQSQRLDALLTALVLVAGADKIADVLKGQGTSLPKAEPPPIKVTGTLTLDEGASARPTVRERVG